MPLAANGGCFSPKPGDQSPTGPDVFPGEQVAQRTAAHCESLVKQLQQAKEQVEATGSTPSKAQIDAILKQLVLEKEMKERALAELKLARGLASKAMMIAEQEGFTSPASPARASRERATTASVSSLVQGWSTLCSTALTKGADWLYTAQNAEREIDKILTDYHEGPSRGKSPRRPDPRTVLDRVGSVVDARKKHLRRQEDDLKGLLAAIRKWDDESKSLKQQV